MEAFLATVASFLAAAVRVATPLTFAGIGEAFSERAGIVNIGVEAIMLAGAYAAFMATFTTGSILLGALAGIAGGVCVSMIHALLSIRCRANQNIAGLALNTLTLGLTSFLFMKGFGQSTVLPTCAIAPRFEIPLLSKIPLIGPAIFSQSAFEYALYLIVAASFVVFYKTEWGVWLTSVGEHPRAADTAGLNVFRIRYLACLVNGILGGLGGAYITIAQLGFFMEDVNAGRGYIALVAVILGRRNPLGILASALVIGLAQALQLQLQTMRIGIPSQAFSMLPYVAAVVVLLFSIGKGRDPAALGVPYERDKR